jgi:hypothetical protein
MKRYNFTLLLALFTLSGNAHALVPQIPEPSVLSLLGIGAVAGILAWRINRKR